MACHPHRTGISRSFAACIHSAGRGIKITDVLPCRLSNEKKAEHHHTDRVLVRNEWHGRSQSFWQRSLCDGKTHFSVSTASGTDGFWTSIKFTQFHASSFFPPRQVQPKSLFPVFRSLLPEQGALSLFFPLSHPSSSPLFGILTAPIAYSSHCQ